MDLLKFVRRFFGVAWLCLGCLPLSAQRLEQGWMEAFSQVPSLWDRSDTVSVIFIGDVMMHTRQLQYDCTSFLEGIRDRLASADLAVANMEFTLAGEPYSGYPCFSAPDVYAEYVRDCGVDVFLTANNHILDKGVKGLERTLEVYRKMPGVRFTGAARDTLEERGNHPLIVPVRGLRIALVNFTYGTNVGGGSDWPKVNRMDKADISRALERAREQGADFVVALPHWGEEYALTHNARQEEMARWLAEQGADAVVGAHPHVVQDTSVVTTSGGRKVPVIYSLGNAVSNMSAPNTRLELAVTLRFVLRPWDSPRMLAPRLDFLWCTLPGRLTDNYRTLCVRDWIGRREAWMQPSDYDNMLSTYERVKTVTGIQD
ncbi:MAG: CapA family protein [Bacteroidales bacterium]|nr:CapA family protein [Bacteroidales bacterium]